MRIWMVNQHAIPPALGGGTRHYSLGRELVRRGHSVTILAAGFNHTFRKEVVLRPGERWRVEEHGGVRFVWLRTPPYSGNTVGRVWNMVRFLGEVLRRPRRLGLEAPDVVLGSNPHLFGVLAASRLARRHGAPFVFEVRDIWPLSLEEIGGFSRHHPLIFLLDRLETHLYRRADGTVMLMPRCAAHIWSKGIRPRNAVWVPNGVDLDLVPEPAPPGPRQGFTVMYCGAHGVVNRLDTLLDAARLLRDRGEQEVRFILVGDGAEKARLQVRAAAEGLDNVSFRDPVPKREVFRRMQEADALVAVLARLRLYQFGMSLNKLFDYLAAGRPVLLASDAVNDPVRAAGAGLTVPPEDPAALAEAILRLSRESPARRWEMGRAGRRYAEANHDIRRLAGKLEGCLLRAVAAARRRQGTAP